MRGHRLSDDRMLWANQHQRRPLLADAATPGISPQAA
jgi:hypothetical protein